MYKFIVFGLLVAAVATISAEQNLDCFHHEDQISCYCAKLMNTVSRAARSTNVNVMNRVSLVSNNSTISKFIYKKISILFLIFYFRDFFL